MIILVKFAINDSDDNNNFSSNMVNFYLKYLNKISKIFDYISLKWKTYGCNSRNLTAIRSSLFF